MKTVGRRIKRTYNLSRETVETVRELQAEYAAGPTQDAVVERAVRDLARHLRDERDATSWAKAARDPEFQGEVAELEAEFAADDRRAWSS